jgi:hypothetical protein
MDEECIQLKTFREDILNNLDFAKYWIFTILIRCANRLLVNDRT